MFRMSLPCARRPVCGGGLRNENSRLLRRFQHLRAGSRSGPLDQFGLWQRWPGVIQAELGSGRHVIEEGLSGRTTVRDDPVEGEHKNRRRYLKPCLQSHTPVDLLIITLGTNDLKRRYNQPAPEVAIGIGCLFLDTRELGTGPGGKMPGIMIVAPPPMHDDLKEWHQSFDGAPARSRELALAFEIIADSLEVHFFDAASVCTCDPVDGFHLSAEARAALGAALAREIVGISWLDRS